MGYFKFKNFFVILLSLMVFLSLGSSIVAHADEDENEDAYETATKDEEEDDEDNYEQQVAQPIETSVAEVPSVKAEKPKVTTQTIVDPPTFVTVNETKTIEVSDRDRDGLIDSEDPHPDMAEIYFVKDDNQNGIVDDFE
jgi:hypothetical protein